MPGPTIPWAPWEPDKSEIAGRARKAKGVFAQGGKYVPLPDVTLYGTGTLGDACLGAAGFYDKAGGVRIYLGDATALYEVRGGAPAVISRDGGYAVDRTSGWSFSQFGANIFAAGRGAPLQYIEAGGTGKFADVPDAPVVDCVFAVRAHMLGASGNRLNWSAFNNPLLWDVTQLELQAGFTDLPQPGGNIVAGIGGEVGVVFQERMVSRLSYVGGSTIWDLDTVENNRGALGRRAVSPYGRAVLYVSEDGFFAFTGMESQPIGDNRVSRYFVRRLNYAQRHLVSCAVDTARKCWMILFPSGSSATPNEVIIYSMTDDRWTHDEIDLQMVFDMPRPGVSINDDDAFLALFGTTALNSIDEPVNSPLFSESRREWGVVNSSNRVATFSGTNRPAIVETADFEATPGRQTTVLEVWPLIDAAAGDVQVKVKSKTHLQANTASEESSTMIAEGFCPTRAEGRYHAIEMTVTAGTAWTESTGLQITTQTAGGR